nr:immunoglobulin heavy chain junction region [Macaca mulatta]
CARQDNNLDYW